MAVADVLIIGGGPAGSAAAIWAARAGCRVVLLEHRAFPRARPGETLHPGVEPVLEQLGVAAAVNAAGFLRHPGYWVRWGNDAPRYEFYGHDAHGPWLGYQAERATLDAILLQEAVRLGAQVRQPCQAMALLRTATGRLAGIHTSEGAISARVIVDASGRQQWLARRMNLARTTHSAPLTAYYGYLRQEPRDVRPEEPSLQTDAQGWRWTASIRPDMLAWVRLQQGRGPRPSLEACLGADSDLASLPAIGQAVRGEDVTWRLVQHVAGPGYVLAGDAAAILDPAAGHGVLKALMSGMMAAQTALQMLATGDAAQPAAAYCAWLTAWFEHDAAHLRNWYQLLNEDVGPVSKSSALT